MITLFGCTHFFNFVSFLLYPMEVKRFRCAMLGAFTVHVMIVSGLLGASGATILVFETNQNAFILYFHIILTSLLNNVAGVWMRRQLPLFVQSLVVSGAFHSI